MKKIIQRRIQESKESASQRDTGAQLVLDLCRDSILEESCSGDDGDDQACNGSATFLSSAIVLLRCGRDRCGLFGFR